MLVRGDLEFSISQSLYLVPNSENCEKIRNGEFKKPAAKTNKDDDGGYFFNVAVLKYEPSLRVGNDVNPGNVSGKKRKADDAEPVAAPDTKKKKKAGTTAKNPNSKNAKVPKVKGL